MSFYARYFGLFGGGSASSATPFQETPAGLVNNVNVTYTLTNSPVAATLALYLDGLVLKQGVDYTLAGSTITMTTAPSFAQVLYAIYSY